jgi:hypothetical protein
VRSHLLAEALNTHFPVSHLSRQQKKRVMVHADKQVSRTWIVLLHILGLGGLASLLVGLS